MKNSTHFLRIVFLFLVGPISVLTIYPSYPSNVFAAPGRSNGTSRPITPKTFHKFSALLRKKGLDPTKLKVIDNFAPWKSGLVGGVTMVYDGKSIGGLDAWSGSLRAVVQGDLTPSKGHVFAKIASLDGSELPQKRSTQAMDPNPLSTKNFIETWPNGRSRGEFGGKGLGALMYIMTATQLYKQTGVRLELSSDNNSNSRAVWQRLINAGFAEAVGNHEKGPMKVRFRHDALEMLKQNAAVDQFTMPKIQNATKNKPRISIKPAKRRGSVIISISEYALPSSTTIEIGTPKAKTLRLSVPYGLAKKFVTAAKTGVGVRLLQDENMQLRLVAGTGQNTVIIDRTDRKGNNGEYAYGRQVKRFQMGVGRNAKSFFFATVKQGTNLGNGVIKSRRGSKSSMKMSPFVFGTSTIIDPLTLLRSGAATLDGKTTHWHIKPTRKKTQDPDRYLLNYRGGIRSPAMLEVESGLF